MSGTILSLQAHRRAKRAYGVTSGKVSGDGVLTRGQVADAFAQGRDRVGNVINLAARRESKGRVARFVGKLRDEIHKDTFDN